MLNSEQRRQFFLELFDTDLSLINALNSKQCQLFLDAHSAVRGIINEQFNEANSKFPVSKADFILHKWLTSYCNSMVNEAKAKGYTLLLKKNVKPPIRRRNDTTNNVNAKSTFNQSDMNETDNSQDSLDIDQEKNKVTKAKAKEQAQLSKKKHETDNSQDSLDIDQEKNKVTKAKAKEHVQPSKKKNDANNAQDSLDIEQEKNDKVTETKAKGCAQQPKKKNVRPPIRRCNVNTNNVNDVKNTLDQSDMDDADNAQDSLDINQEKEKKVTKVKAKGDTDNTDNVQDSFGNNNSNNVTFDQDNTHKAANNSDTLTTIIDIHDNSSQNKSLTLTKNRSRKNIQPPIQSCIASKNKDQNNRILSDNVSSLLKNILHSSQKHGNIKNVEHNEQNTAILDEIGEDIEGFLLDFKAYAISKDWGNAYKRQVLDIFIDDHLRPWIRGLIKTKTTWADLKKSVVDRASASYKLVKVEFGKERKDNAKELALQIEIYNKNNEYDVKKATRTLS
ncbi:17303_t:CDS:10 [Gigaspora margarita]|uniref:17303_t:CDS:1 n=1 Tax=Gigaspora margarita TaxID=4874 RepID=A0ABM8W374_GIGMA|nr:17303_t:CDS:10 [Gigaspora margarita]